MSTPRALYGEKCDRLAARLHEGEGIVGLAKDTSNLFRDRAAISKRALDVREFNGILQVDREAGFVEAEGMVPYETLVDACLEHEVMPAVVPELKTITLGGALAGVGVEATSHRHGLVHETALELEVLTGDGRFVVCSPDNDHADLFYGMPNSYGTLGYALRIKARVLPVLPFVHVEHLPFTDARAFFEALESHCRDDDADFIDGTVFAPDRMYLSLGRFAADAPFASDYGFEQIYYRSIEAKREDWLATRDYIWRWDTDWFWCSKNVYAQHPLVRRLLGRKRLGSRTYTRLMRWNSRVGLTRRIERMRGLHSESVIQDIDIPIARAAEYLEFHAREIGIWPMWVCPIGVRPGAERFVLYPLNPGIYVNFGFWDLIRTRSAHPAGHFNRMVEDKVSELGGIKSLYSQSFYERSEFDRIYGGNAYYELKEKYDPGRVFPELYEKCVLGH
ncbi:MAG TPA: FAD-binding oxidoreductase [Burkholderiales bacterium]|nr:FAD-binding oxidoreductase [Burkholderiales bacterium]